MRWQFICDRRIMARQTSESESICIEAVSNSCITSKYQLGMTKQTARNLHAISSAVTTVA